MEKITWLIELENNLKGIIGNVGYTFLVTLFTSIIEIIIIYIGYKLLGKVVKKFFDTNLQHKERYHLNERRVVTLKAIILSVIKYVFYFFVFSKVITIFGGEGSVQSIITVAGVGGVAIAFGAQSLVKDVITGCFLLLEDQIAVGDIIEISSICGTVEELGIRTTKIRGFDGDLHIIPNGQITTVSNKTRDYKNAIVDIGICYEDDLEHVLRIMENEMSTVYEQVLGLQEKPAVLGVIDFADSAVVVRITARCDIKQNAYVEREIRKYIKIRFDREGISMPYPHRTIDIVGKQEV